MSRPRTPAPPSERLLTIADVADRCQVSSALGPALDRRRPAQGDPARPQRASLRRRSGEIPKSLSKKQVVQRHVAQAITSLILRRKQWPSLFMIRNHEFVLLSTRVITSHLMSSTAPSRSITTSPAEPRRRAHRRCPSRPFGAAAPGHGVRRPLGRPRPGPFARAGAGRPTPAEQASGRGGAALARTVARALEQHPLVVALGDAADHAGRTRPAPDAAVAGVEEAVGFAASHGPSRPGCRACSISAATKGIEPEAVDDGDLRRVPAVPGYRAAEESGDRPPSVPLRVEHGARHGPRLARLYRRHPRAAGPLDPALGGVAEQPASGYGALAGPARRPRPVGGAAVPAGSAGDAALAGVPDPPVRLGFGAARARCIDAHQPRRSRRHRRLQGRLALPAGAARQ